MTPKRILAAHDGSKDADQAFETALVVGHRGRSTIREWLFGSTSRRVVSHAACSVLVVRQ